MQTVDTLIISNFVRIESSSPKSVTNYESPPPSLRKGEEEEGTKSQNLLEYTRRNI